MATPAYVDYDATLPLAVGKTLTAMLDGVRTNMAALIDAADNPDALAVRCEYTYAAAPNDMRVTEVINKHPARWIKTVYTYGTTGAAEAKPVSAAVTYSTDDGVSWAALRTKVWSWGTTAAGRPRLEYTDAT